VRTRRLGPEDYAEMPWKNGGGRTREIGIRPEGATLSEGFLWRVSSAEVARGGPFSRFPGVDRTLLILSGKGMRLTLRPGPEGRGPGDERELLLREPLSPVAFSGDGETRGDLLGGPVRDFNVMVDRARARSRTRVLRAGEEARAERFRGDWILLFAAEGTLEAEGVPGLGPLRLAPGETLWAEAEEGEGPGEMEPRLRGTGRLIAVEIERIREGGKG